jgi:hypothetical protein
MASSGEPRWVEVGQGYEAAIDGERVVYRRPGGTVQKSGLTGLADMPEVMRLQGMTAWLATHARRCRLIAESWMLRGDEIPLALLTALWPDAAWRAVFTNTVLTPAGAEGGLVRGLDPDRGVRVLNPDGTEAWLDQPSLWLPHPATIPALEDFRRLLRVTPRLPQVFRDVAIRPPHLPHGCTQVGDFAGIEIGRAEAVMRRCGRYGYPIRHGHATCPVRDGDREYEARLRIGEEFVPAGYETTVGLLVWIGPDGWELPLAEVGPVGWSEGVRMARLLTAGETRPDRPAAGALAAFTGLDPLERPDDRGIGERGAGRLVVPVAGDAGQSFAEPVRARAYRHAAVADPLVRLVADPLAAGVDAAMGWLGCVPVSCSEVLATSWPAALPFLDYALSRDPSSAVHAISVASQLDRLADKAAGKPADGRRAYTDLVKKVRGAAPSLPPRIYEEGTRSFLASGYAAGEATMQEKVSSAKRFHRQSVDVAHLCRLLHEFALGGGQVQPRLVEYVQLVEAEHGPATTWATVRAMVLCWWRNTAAPDYSLAVVLCELADRAGADRWIELRALQAELLATPGWARIDDAFWRSPLLVEQARSDPALRRRLLSMCPEDRSELEVGGWLTVLNETGALEGLVGVPGDGPAPAVWLSRVVARVQCDNDSGWRYVRDTYVDVLEQMAPRLRTEEIPVDLTGGLLQRASVEVLDLALELGIPLADPPSVPGDRLQLRYGETTRALAHLVADERYGPLLVTAAMADLNRVADHAALHAPVARRFFADVDTLGTEGGLLNLHMRLSELDRQVLPHLLRADPGAAQRLRAADVGAALARTLRGGLFDEFIWPALEEAFGLLPGPADGRYSFQGSWPYLIVAAEGQAVVVGYDRVLFHGQRPPGLLSYVDGQLAADPSYQPKYQNWASASFPFSLELPDGRRTDGGAAYTADRPHPSEPRRLFSDGVGYWRFEGGTVGFYRDPNPPVSPRLVRFDPATGAEVDGPLPAFFAEAAEAGITVEPQLSWLHPLPDGVRSPLGQVGNLTGLAVGLAADGRRVARRLDGSTVDIPAVFGSQPVYLVDMPAGSRPRFVTVDAAYWWITLTDADGRSGLGSYPPAGAFSRDAPGTPLVPPPLFWHFLRPRDPGGSAALRRVDATTGRELVAAAVVGDAPERIVVRLGVSRSGLRAAVQSALKSAVDAVDRITGLSTVEVDPAAELSVATAPESEPTEPEAADGWLFAALEPISAGVDILRADRWGPSPSYEDYSGDVAVHLRAVNAMLRGEPLESLPSTLVDWPFLADHLGAVGTLAISPGTTAEAREALLTFLDTWADGPMALSPAVLRRIDVQIPGTTAHGWWYHVDSGHTYVLFRPAGSEQAVTGVEYAPDGAFRLPAEWMLVSAVDTDPSRWRSPQEIRAFVSAVRRDGPPEWSTAAVRRLADGAGLRLFEAAALLSGHPSLTGDDAIDLRETLGVTDDEAVVGGLHFDELGLRHDRYDTQWTVVRRQADRLAVIIGAAGAVALPWTEVADAAASAFVRELGRGNPQAPETDPETLSLFRPAPPTIGGYWTGLTMLARPARHPKLRPTSGSSIDFIGRVSDDGFGGPMAETLVIYLAWAYLQLPVGHPIRNGIPLAVELARNALADRRLIVALGHYGPQRDAVTAMVGEAPQRRVINESTGEELFDGGTVLATNLSSDRDTGRLYVRPALLSEDMADRIAELVYFSGYAETGNLRSIQFLRSSAGAFAERVRHTPVPVGGYEADPTASVPLLVADVQAALDLSTDAAALYLQTLAVPVPDRVMVCRYNRWDENRYAAAAKELARADLVVEGERERVHRPIFLPGAWQDQAPRTGSNHEIAFTPMERWKLDLYGRAAADPIPSFVCLQPIHQLFAGAWERCRRGDGPQFR